MDFKLQIFLLTSSSHPCANRRSATRRLRLLVSMASHGWKKKNSVTHYYLQERGYFGEDQQGLAGSAEAGRQELTYMIFQREEDAEPDKTIKLIFTINLKLGGLWKVVLIRGYLWVMAIP